MIQKKPSESRINQLLKEYEIGQNHAWKFDTSIWQTASVFIPTSIAGFVFISQTNGFSISRFVTVCFLGFGSISMLVGWINLVNRWENYKRIIFIRLRDIEEQLDLWHNRNLYYVNVDDNINQDQRKAFSQNKKIEELDEAKKRNTKNSALKVLKTIAGCISVSWLVLIIVEGVFTFILK